VAFTEEINKRYEKYGRKFVPMDGPGANSGMAQNNGGCHYPYFAGQCALTPPDPACSRAEAQTIAAMHPAFVLGSGVSAFSNQLTSDGILVLDGATNPLTFYTAHPGYRYGVYMDGFRQANLDGEYFCKRLVGKPANFAGADVKSGRGWGASPLAVPTRKLAILYPKDYGDQTREASVLVLQSLITGGRCNTPGGVLLLPYASDINTAEQQGANITQQLIQNRITTVACWCELFAPIFFTKSMSNQAYMPEHWILGIEQMDWDTIARLYDSAQWQHAFGLSDITLSKPPGQTNSQLWWNDTGRSGSPSPTVDAVTQRLYQLMAMAVQTAGPHLSIQSIYAGLHAMPISGGWNQAHDPRLYKEGFRDPGPFTWYMDAREVYWNASRTSEADGKPGAYCMVAGGRRYDLGEIPAGDPDVFDPAANGC
jgi:hypothetical protein